MVVADGPIISGPHWKDYLCFFVFFQMDDMVTAGWEGQSEGLLTQPQIPVT